MTRFFSFLRSTGWLPLLVFTGLLAPRAASASHALGADMSYVSVGPGIYFVQYRFYRDCSGIPAPSNFTLEYEATGCGAGGTGTNPGGSLTLTPRATQVGNPYCRLQNALSLCDSLNSIPVPGFPNYHIYTYGGVMTIGTSPGTDCSDWVMSVVINARPDTRNLLGSGTDLYTEMHLNTTLASGDASPVFSTLGGLQPLAVMYENTPLRYNGSVVDPDGDSLVYSMAVPLSGPNQPLLYTNGHSLQNPIRLMAGSPPVQLDQQGTLVFTPGQTLPGSLNDVDNKFVFVIQVDAYRRISGVAQKISTVRRELAGLLVRATAPGTPPNVAPAITPLDSSITVTYPTYTQTVSYGDTVSAYAGEALQIDVPFTDLEGDSIFVEMPTANSPAGSTMTAVGRAQVPGFASLTARIQWTPAATDVQSQAHQFYLRVSDNGCPNANSAFYPLAVIVAAQRPLGLTARGNAHQPLRATPNPFGAATRLTVQTTAADSRDAAVQIYDLTGRLLDRLAVPAGAGTHELTWHAPAALPAGMYVARYVGAAGSQTVRLVKE